MLFYQLFSATPTSFQLPVLQNFIQHLRRQIGMTLHPLWGRKVNINFLNFTTIYENLLSDHQIVAFSHPLNLLQLLY